MPTSLVTRINLDLLYPPFLEGLLNLMAKCRDQGHVFYAVSGFRSIEDQEQKYSIGRTKEGRRITNAPGGYSMHNYGIACDLALDGDLNKPGLQPDWENNRGQYAPLQEACGDFGLQVGVPTVPGGDPGHVQFPVVTRYKMQEMTLLSKLRKEYFKRREIKDCWALLDTL